MKLKQYSGWFILVAAALVLPAGLAKVLGGSSAQHLPMTPDPLFGLTPPRLLAALGVAEVVFALACFSRLLSSQLKLAVLGCLSTSLLVWLGYAWLFGGSRTAWWLGSLPSMLGISEQAGRFVMAGLVIFLFAGSWVLLVLEHRAERAAAALAKEEEAELLTKL